MGRRKTIDIERLEKEIVESLGLLRLGNPGVQVLGDIIRNHRTESEENIVRPGAVVVSKGDEYAVTTRGAFIRAKGYSIRDHSVPTQRLFFDGTTPLGFIGSLDPCLLTTMDGKPVTRYKDD